VKERERINYDQLATARVDLLDSGRQAVQAGQDEVISDLF
jgi:hypothetical protein